MQSAGRRKQVLLFSNPVRHSNNKFAPERGCNSGERACSRDFQCIERGLATHAAARRRVDVPLEAREVDGDVRRELDDNDVAGAGDLVRLAGPDADDVLARGHDPLGEQEAERKLLVVARRPHGHRERPAVDADLQRLLDGDGILAAVVQDDEGVRAAVAHEGSGHAHRVSGRFGAAMVFIPLASVVVHPQVAVPLLLIAGNLATLHITLPSFRRCCWPEILPLTAGAVLTLPIGVALLVSVDPQAMRWAISVTILAAVALLASGWRLERALPLAGTAAVGGLAGLAGGAAGLYGPPLILFWLSGRSGAAQVRDNIYAIFGLLTVAAAVLQGLNGLLTPAVLREALLLLPVYVLGTLAGARLFRGAGDALYRNLALGLCALVALAGLPLWQKF